MLAVVEEIAMLAINKSNIYKSKLSLFQFKVLKGNFKRKLKWSWSLVQIAAHSSKFPQEHQVFNVQHAKLFCNLLTNLSWLRPFIILRHQCLQSPRLRFNLNNNYSQPSNQCNNKRSLHSKCSNKGSPHFNQFNNNLVREIKTLLIRIPSRISLHSNQRNNKPNLNIHSKIKVIHPPHHRITHQ